MRVRATHTRGARVLLLLLLLLRADALTRARARRCGGATGNWGAHYIIPKYMLSPQTAPYVRKTMCQSSTPAKFYRPLA